MITLKPFIESLEDLQKTSDEDLGAKLLAYAIADEASKAGIPLDQIPEQFAERVRQHALTAEANTARNAAVEKALRKAASGDSETAGRLLREHLDREANALKFIPIGINRALQASEFGIKGAKANKSVGAENRHAVLVAATDILAAWTTGPEPSVRRLAELVAQRVGISVSACRTHLAKLREQKKLA